MDLHRGPWTPWTVLGLIHGPWTKKVHGKKGRSEVDEGLKKNKQINFQKKMRSLRKMKRSSEKQDLQSPLFESFSAVIMAKGLPDKCHAPAV